MATCTTSLRQGRSEVQLGVVQVHHHHDSDATDAVKSDDLALRAEGADVWLRLHARVALEQHVLWMQGFPHLRGGSSEEASVC